MTIKALMNIVIAVIGSLTIGFWITELIFKLYDSIRAVVLQRDIVQANIEEADESYQEELNG